MVAAFDTIHHPRGNIHRAQKLCVVAIHTSQLRRRRITDTDDKSPPAAASGRRGSVAAERARYRFTSTRTSDTGIVTGTGARAGSRIGVGAVRTGARLGWPFVR